MQHLNPSNEHRDCCWTLTSVRGELVTVWAKCLECCSEFNSTFTSRPVSLEGWMQCICCLDTVRCGSPLLTAAARGCDLLTTVGQDEARSSSSCSLNTGTAEERYVLSCQNSWKASNKTSKSCWILSLAAFDQKKQQKNQNSVEGRSVIKLATLQRRLANTFLSDGRESFEWRWFVCDATNREPILSEPLV